MHTYLTFTFLQPKNKTKIDYSNIKLMILNLKIFWINFPSRKGFFFAIPEDCFKNTCKKDRLKISFQFVT